MNETAEPRERGNQIRKRRGEEEKEKRNGGEMMKLSGDQSTELYHFLQIPSFPH